MATLSRAVCHGCRQSFPLVQAEGMYYLFSMMTVFHRRTLEDTSMADITVRASGEEEGQEHRPVGFEEDPNGITVPSELLILPLRGVVIFPSAIVPLLISRESSLKLVDDCLKGDRILGLAAQKNAEDENPEPHALFSRGSAGRILKVLKYPDGSVRIL